MSLGSGFADFGRSIAGGIERKRENKQQRSEFLGRIKTDPMWKERQDELEGMSNDQLREIDTEMTISRAREMENEQRAGTKARTDLLLQELASRQAMAPDQQRMAGAQADMAEFQVGQGKANAEKQTRQEALIAELAQDPQFGQALGGLQQAAAAGISIPADQILELLGPSFKPELIKSEDGTTAMTTSRKSAVPVSGPDKEQEKNPDLRELKIGGKTYFVAPGNRYFDAEGNPVTFGGGGSSDGGLAAALGAKFGGGEAAPLSEQDKQAIAWAKANPGDPRAKQILAKHGL